MGTTLTVWLWSQLFHGRFLAEVVCRDDMYRGQLTVVEQATGRLIASWPLTFVEGALLGAHPDDIRDWVQTVEMVLQRHL